MTPNVPPIATGVPDGELHGTRTRVLGFLRGSYKIAEDFNAPLPAEIQRFFEGDDDGVLGGRGSCG